MQECNFTRFRNKFNCVLIITSVTIEGILLFSYVIANTRYIVVQPLKAIASTLYEGCTVIHSLRPRVKYLVYHCINCITWNTCLLCHFRRIQGGEISETLSVVYHPLHEPLSVLSTWATSLMTIVKIYVELYQNMIHCVSDFKWFISFLVCIHIRQLILYQFIIISHSQPIKQANL